MSNLERLKYSELQKIAKSLGIKGNQKSQLLIEEIKSSQACQLNDKNSREDEKALTESDLKEEEQHTFKKQGAKGRKLKASSDEYEETKDKKNDKNDIKLASRRNHRKRSGSVGKTYKVKLKEAEAKALFKDELPFKSPKKSFSQSPRNKLPSSGSLQVKSLYNSSSQQTTSTESVTTNTPKAKSQTSSAKKRGQPSLLVKKATKRKSLSTKTPASSQKNTFNDESSAAEVALKQKTPSRSSSGVKRGKKTSASGRKSLPNTASGRKSLPKTASGRKSLPKTASGRKSLPKTASGRKSLPKTASGRKSFLKSVSKTPFQKDKRLKVLNLSDVNNATFVFHSIKAKENKKQAALKKVGRKKSKKTLKQQQQPQRQLMQLPDVFSPSKRPSGPFSGKQTPPAKLSAKKTSAKKSSSESVSLSTKNAKTEKIPNKNFIGKNSPAKKSPAKKSPTKKSPTRKSLTKKSPTKKSPTKKSLTKKSPTRKSLTKKSPTRKSPAKKSPTRKSPTRKSPAKKSPTKKSLTKKSPTKNSPTRRSLTKKSPTKKSLTKSSPLNKSPRSAGKGGEGQAGVARASHSNNKEMEKESRIPRVTVRGKTKGTQKKDAQYWEKLHQKNQQKLQSIEEYQKSKQRRAAFMLASPSFKPATPATKRPSLATKKAPPATSAFDSTSRATPGRKRRLEEVSGGQAQGDKFFNPNVIDVKNVDMNFVKVFVDVKKLSKIPKPFVFTATTTPGKLATKSLLSPSSGRRGKSPKDVRNATLFSASKKARFDLQESLERPITWVPHKGPLKPFSSSNPSFPVLPENAKRNLRIDAKLVQLKSGSSRRLELKDRQKERKMDVLMSKRGIKS